MADIHSPTLLRFLTFNIANAGNDERNPTYRLGMRLSAIATELKSAGEDNMAIICIQEIRPCLNKNGDAIMSIDELSSFFKECTGMEIASLTKSRTKENPFHNLTLYQPKILTLVSVDIMYPTGHVISQSNFALAVSPAITLSVVNVHFPLGRTDRIAASEFVKDLPRNGNCQVVLGDMNTFPDDGGEEMMEIMCSTGFYDVLHGEKTFHSFPHDSFQGCSPLDHILCKGVKEVAHKIYDNSTYSVRPSDHFMCECTIEILQKI